MVFNGTYVRQNCEKEKEKEKFKFEMEYTPKTKKERIPFNITCSEVDYDSTIMLHFSEPLKSEKEF